MSKIRSNYLMISVFSGILAVVIIILYRVFSSGVSTSNGADEKRNAFEAVTGRKVS